MIGSRYEPTNPGLEDRKRVDDDHKRAYELTADARGNYDIHVVARVASQFAAERAETQAQAIESVRSAWDDQCAGNRNEDACESCRAYADVIRSLGGEP